MQSLSLTTRKNLSPKGLPKLIHGKVGRLFREASADLAFVSPHSPNSLFMELERKLQEQQREITNRDSEVKKVISKFESIAEAHKDQKDKFSRVLEKYVVIKKELEVVKEQNQKLTEKLGLSAEKKETKADGKKVKVKKLKEEVEKRKSVISEKQNLIFALEAENDSLKREIAKIKVGGGTGNEEKSGKYSNAEIKRIVENCAEMEKDLKQKKEDLQNVVNQNLYLMENNQNLATELKNTKLQLLSAKRSQFVTSRTKSEFDLKLETEKNESYKKKLKALKNQIKELSEENNLKLAQANEEKSQLKDDLKQASISLQKSKELETTANEKLKYLEKEAASLREVTNSYKKKFEEISVENGLLAERIIYKDEKIKRDGESIKSLKKIEADHIILKRNYQELEDLYKQSHMKTDKILRSVIQQKEKWVRREDSYKSLLGKLESEKNVDLNEIFKFDLEISELKKEIEEWKIVEQGYVERIKDLEKGQENMEAFWDRVEALVRCCVCESYSGRLVVATPCYHVLCVKCYGGQCKQCYCNISNSVHLELADDIMKLVSIYRVGRKGN